MGARGKDEPRIPGGSLASLIGFLACAAVLVGFFLPWTSHSTLVADGLRVSRSDVARVAAMRPARGGTRDPAARLVEGLALTGNEWAHVLDDLEDSRELTDEQRRALAATHVGVATLPFLAAGLAALLLLLSIPPRRVKHAGLGPIGAVVAIVRVRVVAGLLLILVMAVGILVATLALLLWRGALDPGDPIAHVGHGVQVMAAGGGTAFLSQFLGYGPGRQHAFLIAVLLIVALAIAYVVLGR